MSRKRTREEGEYTTISISKTLKKDLDGFGAFGDNYNDILRRVIEEAKKGANTTK